MRKLTTLLMLLLVCLIGAKAQDRWDTGYKIKSVTTTPISSLPSEPGFYIMCANDYGYSAGIVTYSDEGYVINDMINAGYGNDDVKAIEKNIADGSSITLRKYSDRELATYVVYLRPNTTGTRASIQFATGEFLPRWDSFYGADNLSLSSSAFSAYITKGEYGFVITADENDISMSSGLKMAEYTELELEASSGSDGIYYFQFYPVTLEAEGGTETPTSVSVNFIYKSWSGEQIATTTADVAVNTTVDAAYLTANGLASLQYYKDFIVAGDEAVVGTTARDVIINCTPDFPFTVGTEYALKLSATGKYISYVNETNRLTTTKAEATNTNNAHWKFAHVAGTQDLFTIYNVGQKKYLTVSTTSHSQATYEDTPVANSTNSSSSTSYFRVRPSTNDSYSGDISTYFTLCHAANGNVTLGNHEGLSSGTGSEVSRLEVWTSSQSQKSLNSVFQVETPEEDAGNTLAEPVTKVEDLTEGLFWIDTYNAKGKGALYDYNTTESQFRQMRTKKGTTFESVASLEGIDHKYLWNLRKQTDGTITLQNLGSGRTIVADNSRNLNLSGTEVANLQPIDYEFEESNYIILKETNYTYNDNGTVFPMYLFTSSPDESHTGDDPNLSYWTSQGASLLKFTFYRVGDLVNLYDVTLNYTSFDGDVIKTVEKTVEEGTVINSAYLTANNLATIEYYKDFSVEKTTVNSDLAITVNCTPDFPFSVDKIYLLREDRGDKYASYNSPSRIDLVTEAPTDKNGYFMFEHVPGTVNMFQVYNFGGKGYLTMTNIVKDKYTAAEIKSEPVVWTSGASAQTSQFLVEKHSLYYKSSATYSWEGFRLVHPGNTETAISGRAEYYLDTWNSTSVPLWQATNLNVYEVSIIEDVLLPEYISSPTTLLESTLSQAELASLVASPSPANYQKIIDSLTGASVVKTGFEENVDEDAVYQIEFTRNSARAGVYQTLESYSTRTNNNTAEDATIYGSTTNASANADGVITTTQVATTIPSAGSASIWNDATHLMGSLWKFESAGSGKYYLKNVNSGLYLSGGQGTKKVIFATEKSSAHAFDMVHGGDNIWAIHDDASTYTGGGRPYLNSTFNSANNNYRTTIGYYSKGTNDDGGKVLFHKVTTLPLTVSAAGWTAFCFPVNVVVPEGVTVYQATAGDDAYLHLEEVAAGTVLEAGQGYLCEAAQGAYNFTITAADAADFSTNLLSGATVKRTGMTAGEFYGLGNKGGEVGFYVANTTTVPANKAFLLKNTLSTSGAREMLAFQFGPATGVNTLPATETADTSVLYDLNGRRVYYPVRGIYVTADGKKIFKK